MNLPSFDAPPALPPQIHQKQREDIDSDFNVTTSITALSPKTQPPDIITIEEAVTVASVPPGETEPNSSDEKKGKPRKWFRFWCKEDNEPRKVRSPTIQERLSDYRMNLKQFLGFIGPGYLIAVGYLDPGNWATDLAGGSQFGYSLLFIILCSNFMAILLQSLSIKLGVVSGMDLAQACRTTCPKWVNYILYVLCELAIVACDLAEVIGSAIALNLLFNIPLPWGVALTACDVMIILLLYKDNSMKAARTLESLVMVLVATVGLCYVFELIYSKPDGLAVMKGYLPSAGIFTNNEQLYVAISIIGATVMPHNLYLHSHLVKVRMNHGHAKLVEEWRNSLESGDLTHPGHKLFRSFVEKTMNLSILDSTIALSFALYVNSAILIVAAANFFYVHDGQQHMVADLFDAYNLLCKYLGGLAGFVFGLALLIAGQSSTLTATLAGQVVMEGFLGLSIRPWLRRLFTRGMAIIPAMIIAIMKGQNGLNGMLVASQVALSLQLPFAVIPLVYFTSSKRLMCVDASAFQRENRAQVTSHNNRETSIMEQSCYIDFSNPKWLIGLAGTVSVIILGLDMYLVVTTIVDAVNGT